MYSDATGRYLNSGASRRSIVFVFHNTVCDCVTINRKWMKTDVQNDIFALRKIDLHMIFEKSCTISRSLDFVGSFREYP